MENASMSSTTWEEDEEDGPEDHQRDDLITVNFQYSGNIRYPLQVSSSQIHYIISSLQQEKLQFITGTTDLTSVAQLALSGIHSSLQSLDALGTLLPNIVELRLGEGCTLATFRDLGTSLGKKSMHRLLFLWPSAG